MTRSTVLRVTLVVVGVAMALYGVASLTGAWLGTPPWWATYRALDLEMAERDAVYQQYTSDYWVRWYRRVEGPGFINFEDIGRGAVLTPGGAKEVYRLLPGAPPQREWAEFTVPVRWARSVRADWEGVGWILPKIGFCVALAAAWPRRPLLPRDGSSRLETVRGLDAG